jgi:two-component system phosphate regulon sensor histidine kinase PhoR
MNLARLEDVDAIVNEIVEVEGHGLDTHFFEVDLPEPIPAVWADRTKLEEVFANLIGNAIKFSPRGGTVAIKGEIEDGMLHFSVSDEGIGMSKADQAKLFERFERVGKATSRIPGTGLGLFVCKHLIEAHGGKIWARSTEGEGSTFHFTVPIYDS